MGASCASCQSFPCRSSHVLVGEKLQPSRRCAAIYGSFSTWEQKHFGGPLGGAPARRYVNKWVQRFRSKWGLRRRMLRPEVHQDPASVQNKAGKPEPDGPFFGAGKRIQKRVHQYCFNFPGRFQMRSIFGTPGTSSWHCRCPYFGNWSPIMSTPSMQIGKYSS